MYLELKETKMDQLQLKALWTYYS